MTRDANHPDARPVKTNQRVSHDLSNTVGQRVVRLPTAPRRQVQQPCNKAGREARARLRQGAAERFDYRHPGQRDMDELAKLLSRHRDSPIALMVMAMVGSMTDEQRQGMLVSIAVPAAAGDKTALEAIELIKGTRINYGQQVALLQSFERMNGRS